ncbi:MULTISPECIES: chaperone NapD [Neobacillus]|uniref:Chaperone NapD n=1 Tax=Neobacillus citreus TaxID=2833578 RepID=A0A942SU99_9BACI|nr:chaperone NapD [Neobacillus citreus]MCH6266800.1 chaperone NapD [Neobacillus citreus]
MVISGIYVETIQGKACGAAEKLGELNGVEVHHIHEDKRVILTLETDTVDQSYRTAEKFKAIEGVLGICLVYTNFEDEPFYQEVAGNG